MLPDRTHTSENAAFSMSLPERTVLKPVNTTVFPSTTALCTSTVCVWFSGFPARLRRPRAATFDKPSRHHTVEDEVLAPGSILAIIR